MGNKTSVYATLGASNHSDTEREVNDFYATDPKALELLLDEFTFSDSVWEPCCGMGHLSEVLKARGYNVKSSDIIDRGYPCEIKDFLTCTEKFHGDIVTNPPYKDAQKFIEKSLSLIEDGHYVAMLLKIQFLEGKARRKLFEINPPKFVVVSTSRIYCSKNGDFDEIKQSSAVCFCWFIWEKGYIGDPKIKWFN